MKNAALLTLNRPGAMSSKERKFVVRWLRRQADQLERLGDEYTDTGPFHARILGRIETRKSGAAGIIFN